MSETRDLIARYRLKPHPEGGWYREVHRSDRRVSCVDGPERAALTVILFLLDGSTVSRWHRLAAADESWHFVAGDPLELLTLPSTGGEPQRQRLGPVLADPGLLPLAVVSAGWWQAARSLGRWSLVSCAVGPGFSFDDFALMAELPADARPPGALVAFL